ncbi:Uridine cytidine kinase I [Entamoeba marina]
MSTFTTPLLHPSSPTKLSSLPPLDTKNVLVTFSDQSKETFERPLLLSSLLKHKTLNNPDVVGLMVNGRVHSLNSTINKGIATITPVYLNSYEGSSIYRRTLVMVYAAAVYELYSKKFGVVVEHHVNNGYLSKKSNGESFTMKECEEIKQKIQEFIDKNLPITEVLLSNSEATNYFEQTNRPYTVKLLNNQNSDNIRCSCLNNFLTLFVRPLASSTNVLKSFDVRLSENKKNLVLLFPIQNKKIPSENEQVETKMISQSYEQSNLIGKATKIECVGDLNNRIIHGDKDFILMMENRQDMEIARIAEDCVDKVLNNGVKMISIAGPSASGIIPVVLSVDDYYKHRVESPKDEFGNYDFECLEALRLDDLNDTLTRLFRGEEVHPYVFDFKSGRYSLIENKTMKLPPNGVVIMEGLHGIDDALTPAVPRNQKYYIFIAPLTQINLDEYNFIGNQILRFYRRIVRDYQTRNYSASHTLKSWFVVAKGEEKYIFPYVDTADAIWNSSVDYEISAIYPYVYPLLKTVPVSDPNYNMACDLLENLQLYMPLDDHHISSTSLIREFIGGSAFE